MQTGTLSVSYLGKIPTHGDFVRRHANGIAIRSMDEWFQKGLFMARTQLRGNLDSAYDTAGAYAFHFDTGTGALVGVLRPSRDRVGRKFPFLVAKEMESLSGTDLSTVPVRFNDFCNQASSLVREATAGQVDYHRLSEHVNSLNLRIGIEDEASIVQYLRQTSLTSFWTRLWGHPQDTRKYLVFKNLLDILAPLRNGIPAGYPLALRFPLVQDGQSRAYDVYAWLEICFRLLGHREIQPSFFWSRSEPDSTNRPQLLLTLRTPSPKALSLLLADDLGNDVLCDLEHLGEQSAANAALSIPAQYGALLEDEHISVWEFIERL